MIEFEQIAPHAHRITVMAEFRQADAQALAGFVKEQQAKGGGGNLLIDLTAMAGFSWSAVAEEMVHFPLLLKWAYGLDRIAIVSDEEWVRTSARLESALLPGISYQVYDDDEAETARAWVLEQVENPHTGAFHEIDVSDPKIAAYELSGRLDREESEKGVAMVRAKFDLEGCTRLLLVIRNWHGFDLDRLLSGEVLNGKLEIARKMERYAIVGGPKWIRTYAEFTSNFFSGEIRGFELEDQAKAIAWLSE
ncbi:SpoIIAA family protein [Erythrobacter aurantius]|uniref:STAS/SEC14 domain-containing protein n=1 Tax=Erythrobacter aurantius TaxID=2909249 RepID=UPI0020794EDB|nr:STAS/SEC14 domain-containing protein [Erythrobacter aurantius]